jgi:hypothetical protein
MNSNLMEMIMEKTAKMASRKRMSWSRGSALVALLALAAACGAPDAGGSAADDMTDMPGMSTPGAEPAAGMAQGGMDPMQAHLERMATLPADSLTSALPTHRQMVANMLAQMNREMREMAMPADSAWNAVVDSLRSDLTRMPEMGGAELQALMPAHRERVEQLMAMHAAMMRAMGM